MGTNVGLNLYDWQLRHTGQETLARKGFFLANNGTIKGFSRSIVLLL